MTSDGFERHGLLQYSPETFDRRMRVFGQVSSIEAPMPVAKLAGGKVAGAAIAGSGAFVTRAERVGANLLLARIA